MSDLLRALQSWYEQQCDGDWEHQHGVKIETLDNPGWEVVVELEATPLAGVFFKDISVDRTESDWVRCRVRNDRFEGFGGPNNLTEVLETFLKWAESPPKSDTL